MLSKGYVLSCRQPDAAWLHVRCQGVLGYAPAGYRDRPPGLVEVTNADVILEMPIGQ
jgi:hypothetical protein